MRLCPVFVIGLLLVASCPAMSADWGYEGEPDVPVKQPNRPAVEMKAPPPALIVSPSSAAKPKVTTPPSTNKPASTKPPTGASATKVGANVGAAVGSSGLPKAATAGSMQPVGKVDPDRQASVCWQQLFQIAAKSPLSEEQQKRFESYMLAKSKLDEAHAQEVRSILKFWPALISAMKDKPELEEGYVNLFHALLRIREAMPIEKLSVPGDLTSDSDLITELLGIQRIAVADTPPLTEEAVNAYADLTCFIYEQKNPGKTVDADDNRALLARVVADKFRAAPTENDKRAMAHFDLSWAKFKILWDNADETTRKLMLEKLTKSGAGSTLALGKDPLMEKVLGSWPWPVKP